MAVSCPSDIDLLLIGKTGTGKSATGNSILRRTVFESKSSMTSVTSKVAYEVSEFNGRTIKVVDGPGVGDTRLNNEAAVNMMIKAMEYAISANPRGYHAFLLFLKFDDRFTADDQDTIAFLKKIFHPHFVKKFCILIMTRGDHFDAQIGENGTSFEQWCEEQEGCFKTLMQECDNRIVLFDNSTKDQTKKNTQIENLLKIVDNLKYRDTRYNDENFALAREARTRISVELKKKFIEEETIKETSLILLNLEEFMAIEDLKRKVKPLEKLKVRVERLLESLDSQDKGTGALCHLRTSVESTHINVINKIQLCRKMIDESETAKRREEELQRIYADVMKNQTQQSERERQKYKRLLEQIEKERVEMNEKYKQQHDEFVKAYKNLQDTYRTVKQENDAGIVEQIVDWVLWPLKKTAHGIDWALSKVSQSY